MILLTDIADKIIKNLDVAVVGYIIVFSALILLYLIFTNLPKVINYLAKKRLRAEGKTEIAEKNTLDVTGPEGAAIAMALQLYFAEQHDDESGVITIKNVSRRYSPWSSKLYGMRETPRSQRR